MFYLQHEALFHLTGKVLNLTNPSVQAALLEKCQRDKMEVLILDNLSCLFTGIKENDADAWEQVLPWLLDLRRSRIAVIFIAHAGRNRQAFVSWADNGVHGFPFAPAKLVTFAGVTENHVCAVGVSTSSR